MAHKKKWPKTIEKKPRIIILCPICKCYLGDSTAPGADDAKIMKHMDLNHPLNCYCGELLHKHKRCGLCGIYIGPKHHEHEFKMMKRNSFPMPNIKQKRVCICGFCLKLLERRPHVAVQCGMPYLKGLEEKEEDAIHSRSNKKRDTNREDSTSHQRVALTKSGH